MKISAYAKLNLCLDITGRREDGYHLLDMVMQEIDLFDELEIVKAEDITVSCDVSLPKRNTVYVAAEKFFEYTGIKGGAHITLKKHIPEQAGLGGGSSDAAAVISALSSIYDAGLSESALSEIASFVGSDVPFFIKGSSQRVMGIGEIVIPVKNNISCFYVLAKPKKGVSTAEAYKKYHETQNDKINVDAVIAALEKGDIGSFAKNTGNVLQKAALLITNEVAEVLSLLADADHSMMTGSGSCVFGMYENKNAAEAAFERIQKNSTVDFCCICQGKSR